MKDWVMFLTAIVQMVTAIILLVKADKDNKKGTKRKPPGKRK